MATNSAPFPASGESPYGSKVKVYIDTGDAAVEAAAVASAVAAASADATTKVSNHTSSTHPHSQYARLAENNSFTGINNFNGITTVAFSGIGLRLNRSNGTPDERKWGVYPEGPGLRFRPLLDNNSSNPEGAIFDIHRDGQFGAGGILHITGTGNPNGVHAAPIGSVFRNTEAGGWNGARVWRKDSGSGNTGWVVESGDTGWRDVSSFLMNGWEPHTTAGIAHIRRVNATTYGRFRLRANSEIVGSRNGSTSFFSSVSSGFLSGHYVPEGIAHSVTPAPTGVGVISHGVSSAALDIIFPNMTGTWAEGDRWQGSFSAHSPVVWPTTLPGTPA